MTLLIDLGRDGGEGPVWNWRPGRFRSRIVTRVWWGPIAIGVLHVPHKEYATTSYDWLGEKR